MPRCLTSKLLVCVALCCAACSEDIFSFEPIPFEILEPKDFILPIFTPCPDGWMEEELDAGGGYVVTFCEPPKVGVLGPEETEEPVSPHQPATPNFLPCPSGWTEVEDETTGVVSCDPFGEGGQLDCDYLGADYAHFLGEAGCTRIGTECPSGLWATNLPSGRNIIYVQAGAPEGGDGSETSPFGSINQALDYAGSNAVIALSKGTFHESVELRHGITLWGACVRETIIEGNSTSEDDAVITSSYPDTEVRNLQITGEQIGVWVEGNSASFHVEDVVVRQTAFVGM